MAELNNDIYQYAKDLAKAEKELQIDKWVMIDIGYYTPDRQFVLLHRYNLPRAVYERRSWVVRWRTARLQCTMPKQPISTWFSYYDKRSGLPTGIGSDLGKLAAAKAQVTKQERAIQAYIKAHRGSLFFDEATDEQLAKARAKLQRKIEGVRLAEERLEAIVKSIKQK